MRVLTKVGIVAGVIGLCWVAAKLIRARPWKRYESR